MYKKISIFTLFASSVLLVSACSSNESSNSLHNNSVSSSTSPSHTLPFLVQIIPQDFTYKERHYRVLQDSESKNSIDEGEIGDLLGYIIHEDDIGAFLDEHPNTDYVIDNYVYDLYNQNRIPFFMVVGYDDLSLIYCTRSLYQDITDFSQSN